METQPTQRPTAAILGPNNWTEWIRSIQRRAETLGVWKYIDPAGAEELRDPSYPEPKDVKSTATKYSALSDDEKEELKEQRALYRQNFEIVRTARLSIDKVSVIIEQSINPAYLSILNAATTTGEALQKLQDHLRPANDEAKEALKAKYRELCKPPTKTKVEQWTLEWESAFREAKRLEILVLDDETMSQDFLTAVKKLTPDFSANWAVSKRASKQQMEFYETVKEFRRSFRLSELGHSSSSRSNAFAVATLQGQNESPKNGTSQDSRNKRPCLCGEAHSLRKCPYLAKRNQPANWKPDSKVIVQIKQKIESSRHLYLYVKQFQDTKILEDIAIPTTAPSSDDGNTEASPQRSKLHSGLVATSLYVNDTSTGLHPLKDSIVWDSGAACHISNNLDRAITPLQPLSKETFIATASGEEPIVGVANIAINCQIDGRVEKVVIKDTYFAPTVVTTMISGRLLRDKGVRWDQDTDRLNLDGYEFCQLEVHEGLWTMEYNPLPQTSAFTVRSAQPRTTIASPQMWHYRLGHCGPDVIQHLTDGRNEISVTNGRGPVTNECETCAVSKAHQIISRRPAQRAVKPFERIHFDLMEFERGFDGSRYLVHFTDDLTRMHWSYPISNKSQSTLLSIIKYFVNMAERTYNSSVAIFRTDQEAGIGREIEHWIQEIGITFEYSATDTKEQNGSAERSGGVLETKARCIRIAANFPEEMWPECILAATYLLNRTPMKQHNWKSPLEKLLMVLDQSPRAELAHLKVFGCRAYPLLRGNDKPPKSAKLRARAAIGYLIGYENQNTYRIWIPSREKVIGCRDVTFDETKFFDPADEQKQSQVQVTEIIDFEEVETEPLVRVISEEEEQWLMTPPSARAARDTVTDSTPENMETDQTVDKDYEPYPQQMLTPQSMQSLDTPQTPESEQEQLEEAPEELQAPLDILNPISADLDARNIVEQSRTRKPSARAQGYAVALLQAHSDKIPQFHAAFTAGIIKSKIHRDQLPPPPTSWRALLKHPHAEGFKHAAKLEYEALKSKDTFKIIRRPPHSNPLPLKWVFLYKFNQEGYLVKYKARICVRGDLQPISLQETYAATLAFRVFRALMALAAAFGLKAEQLDAVNAFLNAELDEKVHCRFPEGFEGDPNDCLQLLRALYGLRRSPLLWLQELTAALFDLGLRNIPGEPCLFTDDNGIILFFYVDDIVLLYHPTKQEHAQHLKRALQQRFEIRDLGDLQWFLGVRVVRDIDNGKLWLCQDSYIEKITASFNLERSKTTHTPMPTDDLSPNEHQATAQEIHGYQSRVGSLLFAAVVTRPDIARAASKLSEHLRNPTPDHLAAADQCISYLYSTRHLAIEYSASANYQEALTTTASREIFDNSADASFANNPDRRSGEGYVFKLYGGPIDWASRKQSTVTTSTTEAELLALLHAGKQAIWWNHLFEKLHFNTGHELSIKNDNRQTIRLLTAQTPVLTTKLRHVDISQHWLREQVQNGILRVEWVATNDMTADGLTKALPRQKQERFVRQLGLVDIKERLKM